MKNLIPVFLLFIMITSCSSDAEERAEQAQVEWSKYNTALEMNDYESAISFVYNIIALDSNNYSYYDTLARLYFASKEYSSALASAEKAMSHKLNEKTVEIAYNCSKGNDNLKALEYGEMLLSFKSDSISLLYDMSLNHARQFNYDVAKTYLDQIILDPTSIEVSYQEFRGNGVQEVPYRAAAYNLLGFIHSEKGEKNIAKDMFKSAISYKQDYILAIENLMLLDSTYIPEFPEQN